MAIDEAAELGHAGRRVFDSLADESDPYWLTAMIIEASRMKDRLDLLNLVNNGDEDLWLRLVPSRGDAEVLEIKIDTGLQEARQLAGTLRQLIADIRRNKDGGGVVEDDDLANL